MATAKDAHVTKVFVLCVLLLPSTSNALSVETYKKLLQDQYSQDESTRLSANVGIHAYMNGISETYDSVMSADRSITFNGKKVICLPPTVTIDKQFVKTIIDQELDNPIYKEVGGSEWQKKALAPLAFFGLARSFPCK